MGFFNALRRVLSGNHDTAAEHVNEQLNKAWGLEETASAESTSSAGLPAADPDSGKYDQAQWHKKLKRILEELPVSQHEWPDLIAEARALGFDRDWVETCQKEEFLLLIRRAVSDRHVSEKEHRKLDLARDLIGIPEAEAVAALDSIVAEAESFFGARVEE